MAAIIADVRARGDAARDRADRAFRPAVPHARNPRRLARRDRRRGRDRPARGNARRWNARPSAIRAYHVRQLPQDARWTDPEGATLGWRWTPVSAAGLYVPGGLASYPSSVLMNAIPAQVAGVERLVMCAPTPDGRANPLVLLAAHSCRASTRSIASAARRPWPPWPYGTATIAPVDKITGPGNAYVAAAKRRVFGRVGIDMIAGPLGKSS